MAAPDIKSRTADAQALFNYGFSACRIYQDKNPPKLPRLAVLKGEQDSVPLAYESPMSYVSTSGEDLSGISRKIRLPKTVQAPVKKGSIAGKITYSLDGKKIGHVNILYAENVKRAAFSDNFLNLVQKLFFL